MRIGVKAIVWSVLLFWLSACSANTPSSNVVNTPMVTSLASDRFCGFKSGATIISSPSEKALQSMAIYQTITRLKLDWSNYQILRIDMGQQPNMGYSLEYRGGATIDSNTLYVPVQWNTPQPGMMYGQMLVQPCLLLSIPRTGYEQIDIRDQDGRLRWSVPLSVR